ncbi:hypothetical protein Ciccas_009306 [Cichlidogyrus casuarinus]|uniref:Uncharacterized protein n=1 Tax=Cichlidogyrus casuarinus TaxID=1844966 RepID=A0ABD2PXF1_9PLAT
MECDFRNLWPVMKSTFSGTWNMYWEFENEQRREKLDPFQLQNGATSQVSIDAVKSVLQDAQKQNKLLQPLTGLENYASPWDVRFKKLIGVNEDYIGTYTCRLKHVPMTGDKEMLFIVSRYVIAVSEDFTILVRVLRWSKEHRVFIISLAAVIAVLSIICFVYFMRSAQRAAREDLFNKAK